MIFTVLAYLAFAALLVAVAVVDMRTLRIPNRLVAALIGVWIAWRLCLAAGAVLVGNDFVTGLMAPDPLEGISLASGIIGATVLGGGLLIVTTLYEAVTKKRAMGGGDIKLLLAVGLFLGLQRGMICLFVACFASLVMALAVPRIRWGGKSVIKNANHPVLKDLPFGPSIAIGSAAALVIF